MLRVFAGEDRVAAERAVKATLGGKYEVFDGEGLLVTDLPSIFRGMSLFETEKRAILVKNLGENTAVWEKVADYLDTPHEVVIWELKLDKRSAGYKRLKAEGVEIREFAEKRPPEMGLVFGILDTALRNGPEAVKAIEKIEEKQDPYMFFGLLVTQAMKKYTARPGARERRVLKILAELDLQMKSTAVEPWTLVKAALLRLSSDD